MSFVSQLSANWFRYAPKSGKSPGWLSATPLVRNAIMRALAQMKQVGYGLSIAPPRLLDWSGVQHNRTARLLGLPPDLDIDPQAHSILYLEKRDEGDQYGIGGSSGMVLNEINYGGDCIDESRAQFAVDSSQSDSVCSGDGLSSGFNKVVMEAMVLCRGLFRLGVTVACRSGHICTNEDLGTYEAIFRR
ncbi:hypothetical protein ACJJTC_002160 [Scirpophaga incertulas]